MDETGRVEVERVEDLRDRVRRIPAMSGGMNFGEWLSVMKDLQEVAYGKYYDELTADEAGDTMMMNLNAAHDEISEMGAEMGWKPWASPRGWVHRDAAINEAVDVMHFLANLLSHCQCTGDELTAAYKVKMLKNLDRQLEGYDGVTSKCAHCHTDLTELFTNFKISAPMLSTPEGRKYFCTVHHFTAYREAQE